MKRFFKRLGTIVQITVYSALILIGVGVILMVLTEGFLGHGWENPIIGFITLGYGVGKLRGKLSTPAPPTDVPPPIEPPALPSPTKEQ